MTFRKPSRREASRGAVAEVSDSKRNRLWVRFPFEEIKYLIFSFPRSGNKTKFPSLSSATHHAILPEF